MASKTQKIRVGLFLTIALALLGAVLVVFGGLRFWEHRPSYTVVFDGSVYGLEAGARVFMNGVRVGRVDAVELDGTDPNKIVVGITVDDGTPIHTDTKAVMPFAGITGLKVVDLRDGSVGAPLLAEGGTIAQGETLVDRLTAQATELADQSALVMRRVNQVVDNLATITDPKKFEAIADILAETRQTSHELHAMIGENRTMLRATITTIRDTAQSASDLMDGQVSTMVGNAGDFVAELKSMLHNNEGQLRSAMFDLRQASRSFKELARDVRQRPSRLLFSSAPSERKLP